jgi:guanyl-specific ribonuclease Sa
VVTARIRRFLCLMVPLAAAAALSAAGPPHDNSAARRAVAARRASDTDRVHLPGGRTVDVGLTLDRIASGGTNPHRNDGSRFNNYPDRKTGKRLLPEKPSGYYTEFVHPTPGISHAGPQPIIVGRNGEAYYSPDHYRTAIPLHREK